MKIILFLLLSITVYSQNLTINKGDVITINSNYQNITFNGKGKLIVDGNVSVQNMNINGNGHITITSKGFLNLQSSVNLNGDTLIVHGKLSTSAIEVQGTNAYLYNTGSIVTTSSDLQINSSTGVVKNCGEINIKQSFNINNGKYISCDCGVLRSDNINPNSIIEGLGSFYFNTINLTKTFTESEGIYVYFTGTVNQPKWGKAKLNSTSGCSLPPLPIKIIESNFTHDTFEIKFTENSDAVRLFIEISDDSIQWKEYKEIKVSDSKTYKGKL